MARDDKSEGTGGRDVGDVVSVVGPGMEVVGDIRSDGTVRVEGRVEGSIKAAKSVVVGREGRVDGDIETQDVVVAGRISGTVVGESRVELKDSCHVEGDIRSRRIKLDEGGQVDGRLQMGQTAAATQGKGTPGERPASTSGTRSTGSGGASSGGGSTGSTSSRPSSGSKAASGSSSDSGSGS